MKLSDLHAGNAPSEGPPEFLPYPCSGLADPPITISEARAIDLARDTTICRWHRGEWTQLNVEGNVYFCPIGRMYWRHTRLLSDYLTRPRYPKVGV